MREAYLMQADLTPIIGWETGRASEPAFMDMNLHSVVCCLRMRINPAPLGDIAPPPLAARV